MRRSRPRSRRVALAATAGAATLALGGCASGGEETLPAACRSGPEAVKAALAAAPDEVRIGGTPLSGCLTRESDSADLQTVGATYLDVAADLADAAREDPESPAATQLGYLIGAAQRGAERTQGIHDELVRRLEQEKLAIDDPSAALERGEQAGRASG